MIDAIMELADTTADDTAQAAKNQAEHHALRSEWGQNYDQKVELGRRAARAMGITQDDVGKIESALGTRFVFEKFAALGEGLREDVGVGATAGAGSTHSALQRIEALRADPDFLARKTSSDYRVADAAAKELSELYKQAYPE